jgi:hypothetical protein
MKAAMSLDEAAAQTPFSAKTLRRAIQTTGVDASGNPTFPPPLPAKRGARGAYVVLAEDLQQWLRSLPAA